MVRRGPNTDDDDMQCVMERTAATELAESFIKLARDCYATQNAVSQSGGVSKDEWQWIVDRKDDLLALHLSDLRPKVSTRVTERLFGMKRDCTLFPVTEDKFKEDVIGGEEILVRAETDAKTSHLNKPRSPFQSVLDISSSYFGHTLFRNVL
jgi:hypothetical protein